MLIPRKLRTLAAAVLLSGCAEQPVADGPPANPPSLAQLPDTQVQPVWRGQAANPQRYTVRGKQYEVLPSPAGYVESGIASWYGRKFHGNPTSSGETFDMYAATAAHKTLPIPCYARVTHLENGRSIVVRINDRGPFHPDRIIDLSWAAAAKLGITETGTGRVEVRAIEAQTGAGRWLQVGAYRSRSNADRQLASLRSAGFNQASILSEDDGDTTLYRLRLGPYEDADTADRDRQQLQEAGFGRVRPVGQPH